MKSLPHVTTVIRAAGLMPPVWDEEACEAKAVLGTEVHRLCQRRKAPAGPAGDYARTFLRWLEESKAQIRRAEFKIETADYVGRCDLEWEWNGELWRADIKTGAPQRWHGVQLAAYCPGTTAIKRGVLWLSPARARLYCQPPIITPGDLAAWQACLALWKWRGK